MEKSRLEINEHQDKKEKESAVGDVTQHLSRVDLARLLHQTGGVDSQDLNESHLQQSVQDFARVEPSEEASIDDLFHGPRPIDQLVDEVLFRAELLLKVTGRSEGFDGLSARGRRLSGTRDGENGSSSRSPPPHRPSAGC